MHFATVRANIRRPLPIFGYGWTARVGHFLRPTRRKIRAPLLRAAFADFRKLLTDIRTALRPFSPMPFFAFAIHVERIDRWHIASLGGGFPLARRPARTAASHLF